MMKTDADGVHLGKDDGEITTARKILGEHAIIGVSCYNQLSAAKHAVKQGASYIAFGAFYSSPTKPNAEIAPLNLIKQAQYLDIPICCIGGITYKNAKPLVAQGANMIAVISDLFNFGGIKANAEKFTHLF